MPHRTIINYVVMERVAATNATRWAVDWTNTERTSNLARNVAGTVTVTALAPGSLANVSLVVANGSCSTPSCPSNVSLVRNVPLLCNFTCTENTTVVTPTAVILGDSTAVAVVNGSAAAVTPTYVKGASACVMVTAP